MFLICLFFLLVHPSIPPSGGFRAGVPCGEEGGGERGADGLVEDDVRDTELLTVLIG